MTYGCFDRKPFQQTLLVQDGWTDHRVMVEIPFRMAETCQYTLTELGKNDPQCSGCKEKK